MQSSRPAPSSLVLLPVLSAALLAGCGQRDFLGTGPCQETFGAGPATSTCPVPGWEGRDYDLVLPEDYDPAVPVPVVLAFHGGGSNRAGAAMTTCSQGRRTDRSCLHTHARANGYAVVFPDGTSSRGLEKSRTWNAGGGTGDWRCTAGRACEEDVDDMAWFDALMADLEGRVSVDPDRIHATGLSNGGAISHRLACERAERIASIAPVGGAMQLTTSDECAPSEPVAVMHIHGTEDPAWRYEGGPSDLKAIGQVGKEHVSVQRTLDEWAVILGCDEEAPATLTLADPEDDGTITVKHSYSGCAADLVHLEVQGGGHTWPDGHQYLSEETVGPVWRDWGNEVLWEFFEAHPKGALTAD